MKPALLKTLTIVLIGALAFLLGWHLLHGGWENLKEDWTGKYRHRPFPSSAPLALGPDGYYWGVTYDSPAMPGYIYKMNADGSDWKRLHTFLHDESPSAATNPWGGLVSDGVDSLLGLNSGNAKEEEYGTLYKINATTGVLTTLIRFSGKAGSYLGSSPITTLAPDGRGGFGGLLHVEERMTRALSSSFTLPQTCSPPSQNSPLHLVLTFPGLPQWMPWSAMTTAFGGGQISTVGRSNAEASSR